MFKENKIISENSFPEIIENNLLSQTKNQKPFLKWAGGKTQLIPTLTSFIPISFNRYIEPFIGGGALYFALNHPDSIISDANEELITTYKAVRDDVFSVIRLLDNYKNEEKFFYQIRSLDPELLSNIERAARLIYLNKTCFNGLYRVNKKGKFNVPYNRRTGINFYNKENLIDASLRLKETKIIHCDYKEILKKHANKDDFIFLDPPYQPIGKYSDFKRYTKEFFYDNDQIDLAEEFKKLVNRGCKVILTNSAHPLILDLYKKFDIKVFESKRLISSNPKTRTGKDIIVLGGI